MTEQKELLTAAQMCRVYATAGMAVVWGPKELRRHADLLDEQRRVCEALVAEAHAAQARLKVDARRLWVWTALCAGLSVGTVLMAVWT